MGDSGDPRVYFAAERTLLAWVRTGLAVMGLGFVVARFKGVLGAIRQGQGTGQPPGPTLIGVCLIALGAGAVGMAAWQHARFCRGLEPGAKPEPSLATWSVWFAGLLAMVGVGLAGYILLGADPA